MTAPRILLVDDQRQVSRMLRASLELSGQDYNVADVASAEEALIELSRGPIDLLGTDVRRVERMAQRGEIPCQGVGRHGLRVRVLPHHSLLGNPYSLGLILWG